MRVKDKIAIVTGAHGGIGRASAEALAQEGATVIGLDVKADAPAYTVTGIRYLVHDVRQLAEWERLASRLKDEFGGLDIMVNAAGITAYESYDNITQAVWDDVIAVNQTGLMYAFRTMIPLMLGRNGSIVTISSIFGANAVDGIAAYHASKGAVTLMSRNAAVTYAQRGIRVNTICPGLIDTPMARARDGAGSNRTIDLTPMGRIGRAEEIAAGVLFLASDEASYITGVALPIDGGYLAQ